MRKTLNIFLLVGILFLPGATGTSGDEEYFNDETDFSAVFGEDYKNACNFINTRSDISLRFAGVGISPAFAWAIVFPELTRYSAIKDHLELTTLQTLYVNFGDSYADFSVGQFQMKPSFAQQIETDYLKYKIKLLSTKNYSFDTTDTRKARSERIKRLKDIRWQTTYLLMFIKILDQRYTQICWSGKREKLMWYATAYNAGYWLPDNQITRLKDKRLFHTAFLPISSQQKYAYASISDYFYIDTKNNRKK